MPPVLAELHALIKEDLEKTNQIIIDQLDAQVELIPQLGSHLINSGGKRLRPALTLLTARMFGYTGTQHALLAAVVEFIHTATLLHDDVVDGSMTRRGSETANSVWGSKAPVLVGDFLFSRSFQMLVEHGDLQVLRIIADACAVISEGEVLQLVVTNDLATDEKKYMQVVSSKTATLFSAAMQLGAVLCNRSSEEIDKVANYGLLLGQAYQVVDDALDYSATQETLGKTIGDDYQEGKITLPVIHAYSHGSEEERAFWRLSLEETNHPEDGLKTAIQIIKDRGSLDYAMKIARDLVEQAKKQLATFPQSTERDTMLTLADFAVDRSY
ncbi:MAG: polyprenyl synthetase family protein [Magnetococcales bacterium]|nr:polyprenyl synthetase family protein [Magnetococcales bacterium]